MEMLERRRLTRWNINKQVKMRVQGIDNDMFFQLQDINLKGLKIYSRERFLQNTTLKLMVTLNDEVTLSTEVCVLWHKFMNGVNIYGLCFTRINDTDKEKIYHFVRSQFPHEIEKQWWGGFKKTEIPLNKEKKGGEDMQDRRIFARFEVELPVKLLGQDYKEKMTKARDISAKGVGLMLDEELAYNTLVEMWLELPDRQDSLYLRGKIVWAKEISSGKYRVGVNLDKADFMGLSHILRNTGRLR